MGKIKNMGSSTARFKEGLIVSGSAHQPDGSDSDYAMIVSGSQFLDASGGGGLTIFKGESDSVFLRFINDDDPVSWYAYFAFDTAEHIYMFPGRSQDFYLQTRQSSGDARFPFRVYDNGKAKFEAGQFTGADSRADLPSDVAFFVSGSNDSNNSAVFGGDVVTSGSLSVEGFLSHEDVVMVELSIPGIDIQTDTNAFRFNCPFDLNVEGIQLYLDQHTTAGNVTVSVTNTTSATAMINFSIPGTDTTASTTSVTSPSCNANDIITFAIVSTVADAQGLRANLRFRRRL